MGRAIGLRIPEVVLYRVRSEWHAFSYYIEETESGETAPAGSASDIAAFYEENPAELHGMVCYDLFVCNNDRKPDNFIVGEDRKVWLIDHGNALFYRPTGVIKAGIPRLVDVDTDLSAMFDKPHGFVEVLQSWTQVDEWCARISQIPSHFIRSVIENLPKEVLTEEERGFLLEFLERRKLRMRDIILAHQTLFPGLKRRGAEQDE